MKKAKQETKQATEIQVRDAAAASIAAAALPPLPLAGELPSSNLATWDYFFGPTEVAPYPPSPPPQTREYHPSSPSSSATALPPLQLSCISSSSSSSSYFSTELLPSPPTPPLVTHPPQPLRRISSPSSPSFSTELPPPPPLLPVPLPLPLVHVISQSSSSSSSFTTELLLPPPPPFLLSPNSTTRDYYIISSSEDAPEQPLSRLDSLDYFYFGISTDPDTSPHTGGLETSPRPPPHSMIYNSFVSDHLRGGSSQAASDESIAALSTVTVTVSDTAEVCAVCTDALPLATTASRLPCGHLYHSDCIVQWLSLRNSCPVCRRSIQMLPASFTDEIIVPSLPPNNDPQPTAADQEIAPSPPLPGPRPTMANNHRRRSLPGARRIRKICRRLLNYMGREPSATAN